MDEGAEVGEGVEGEEDVGSCVGGFLRGVAQVEGDLAVKERPGDVAVGLGDPTPGGEGEKAKGREIVAGFEDGEEDVGAEARGRFASVAGTESCHLASQPPKDCTERESKARAKGTSVRSQLAQEDGNSAGPYGR